MRHLGCAECDGTGTIADIDVIWEPCQDYECLCGGHYVPDVTYFPCPTCKAVNQAASAERRPAC